MKAFFYLTRNSPFACLSFTLILFFAVNNFGEQSAAAAPIPPAQLVVNQPTPQFPLQAGEIFEQTIEIRNATDLFSWQMDITFNYDALEIVEVTEGDFLHENGVDTLWQFGRSPHRILAIQARIGGGNLSPPAVKGVTGKGVLLTITFKTKGLIRQELLGLHNVRLSNSAAERIPYTLSQQVGTVPSPRTQIVVAPPVPQMPLAVGDTFTQTIEIRNVTNLRGWRMDIAFHPRVLEVVAVTQGDFLKQGGVVPIFLSDVSQPAGTITKLAQTRLDTTQPGVSGNGDLATLTFRLKAFSEELLSLHTAKFYMLPEEAPSYSLLIHPIVATHQFPPEDINQDGVVDRVDLGKIISVLGKTDSINPRVDVNDDGIVDVLDLVAVAGSQHWGKPVKPEKAREPNAAAPAGRALNLTSEALQRGLFLARLRNDGSLRFQRAIATLEGLLTASVPAQTQLLTNYPNPFNPETWLPYQLSAPADVSISIYSVDGRLVRRLDLGYQSAGMYVSRHRAAYWDGTNAVGEPVASGVYFYRLTAGDFTATRKLLIRK